VTETFPNPTALRKAQQEVAEFHRFQKLSQDLVALTTRSVDCARSSSHGVAGRAGKRTAAAIHQEVPEVTNSSAVFYTTPRTADRSGSGRVALRTALHQAAPPP